MNDCWQRFFQLIGTSQFKVYANWFMSNGATFLFAIPDKKYLEDNKFSDVVEFPFSFDEICRIEIPKRIGQGKLELLNDLESIATIFPIIGLQSVSTPDHIVIIPEEN